MWRTTSTVETTPTKIQTSSADTRRKNQPEYGQRDDCLPFVMLSNKHYSDYNFAVVMCRNSDVCLGCTRSQPFSTCTRGVTSCPSAELFISSKHSVIDASANQDSDHTAMLQPTSAQALKKSDPHGGFITSMQLFLMNDWDRSLLPVQ